MAKYHEHLTNTPQTEQVRPDQVKNEAGGYVFQADSWTRLHRFLILGSEGGTYYTSERELTLENGHNIIACLKEDPQRVVHYILDIATENRAVKPYPALFALALACAPQYNSDEKMRTFALRSVGMVCRIPSHLFQFLNYVTTFRGWGRGLRKAVADTYLMRSDRALVYHLTKYRSRYGWTHADVLKQAHPKTDGYFNTIAKYIIDGDVPTEPPENELALQAFDYIHAVEVAKTAPPEILGPLIREYRLPREVIPTSMLTNSAIWDALLADMPYTALLRNLATMTRIGLLSTFSEATGRVVKKLTNPEAVAKSRIHPMAIVQALMTYSAGKGQRSSHTWEPIAQVVDALDTAFYFAYQNVEPTGLRTVVAIDTSGSMTWEYVAGMNGVSAYQAAAAMAMVHANGPDAVQYVGFSTETKALPITNRQRMDDIIRAFDTMQHGGTDCGAPLRWMLDNRIEADLLILYTDSQTWAGLKHVFQLVDEYRRKFGGLKVVICQMTADDTQLLPDDMPGVLNVVGMDTSVPKAITHFLGD